MKANPKHINHAKALAKNRDRRISMLEIAIYKLMIMAGKQAVYEIFLKHRIRKSRVDYKDIEHIFDKLMSDLLSAIKAYEKLSDDQEELIDRYVRQYKNDVIIFAEAHKTVQPAKVMSLFVASRGDIHKISKVVYFKANSNFSPDSEATNEKMSYKGRSRNNIKNVMRLAGYVVSAAFGKNVLDAFGNSVLYGVFRGSSYPCELCDNATKRPYSAVEAMSILPIHMNCRCFIAPIQLSKFKGISDDSE